MSWFCFTCAHFPWVDFVLQLGFCFLRWSTSITAKILKPKPVLLLLKSSSFLNYLSKNIISIDKIPAFLQGFKKCNFSGHDLASPVSCSQMTILFYRSVIHGLDFFICIGNSTVSRGIWGKYREWYFKIHQNITSRRGEWYLGSFEISRAGIYPKYPEETVLFFVYTTRQRNFALYVTHIFISSRAIDWVYNNMWLNMWSLKHHITLDKTVLECLEVSVLKGGSF